MPIRAWHPATTSGRGGVVAGSVLGAGVGEGTDGRDGGRPVVETGDVTAVVETGDVTAVVETGDVTVRVGGVGAVVVPSGVEVARGPESGVAARPLVGRPPPVAGIASTVVDVALRDAPILIGLGFRPGLRTTTSTTTTRATAEATMNHSRR